MVVKPLDVVVTVISPPPDDKVVEEVSDLIGEVVVELV